MQELEKGGSLMMTSISLASSTADCDTRLQQTLHRVQHPQQDVLPAAGKPTYTAAFFTTRLACHSYPVFPLILASVHTRVSGRLTSYTSCHS